MPSTVPGAEQQFPRRRVATAAANAGKIEIAESKNSFS